jgi:hypothetical protein
MSFFFDVFGSFEVGRSEGTIGGQQRRFWSETEECYDEGLKSAIGCYLFCTAHGDSITPWYVGKTIAKGGFKAEIFTEHKLKIYNDCMREKRGRPVIFLFAMMTRHDEEARYGRNRVSGKRVIEWLERTLMGMCLQKNPELWNIRDCTLPRSVTVRGILGSAARGRPYSEVQEARRAVFIE